jgi:hypothetical protein
MRDHPAVYVPGAVALIAIASFPIAILVHNALSAFFGVEEGVSFLVAVVAAPIGLFVGVSAVASALRREPDQGRIAAGFAVSALGLALIAGYIAIASALSIFVKSPGLDWDTVHPVALPLCALIVVVGALFAAFGLATRKPQALG